MEESPHYIHLQILMSLVLMFMGASDAMGLNRQPRISK